MCAKAINETPKDSTARIVLKMKPNPRCPRQRKLVPTRGKAPVGQFMQQDETHDWYMFDAMDVLAWLVANGAAQVQEGNVEKITVEVHSIKESKHG